MTEPAGPGSVARRVNFNTVVALACVALGVAIWVLVPYEIAEPPTFFGQSASGVGPKLFPQMIAVGFVIIGVLYAVASLTMDEDNGFRGLPASAYVNLAVILAAMILYVLLLRPIGYVASSILVATGISLYYGSRNVVGIAITGLIAPIAIYYLFTQYLNVSLPPFPWWQ